LIVANIKKTLGFFYAELGLVTGKASIAESVSRKLGRPVSLVRYVRGRGWGLKYLAVQAGAASASHLVKAASRVIERRIKRTLGPDYIDYSKRFALEASVLQSLAGIGLGPEIQLCEKGFFMRDFMPGVCLPDLPPGQLIKWLPGVLGSIDRMCDAGIFHTDPNAGNVLIEPESGRVSFIDSEIPARGGKPGEVDPRRRTYCHERLLYSLGLDWRRKKRSQDDLARSLLSRAKDYYSSAGDPALSPERAAALLTGEATQIRMPQDEV